MKIGVITFWSGNSNYGMMLQCWALQQTLKSLGHQPYVIRYQSVIKRSFCRTLLSNIKKNLHHILNYKYYIHNRNRDFTKFRQEHLSFSKDEYHTLIDLRKNPPAADCYITGSDQVWAQLLSDDRNRVYFLDFGSSSTKRVAYAPSFAMQDYPSMLKEKLKSCLLNFDSISVREYDGVNICKSIGIEACKVVDPTLLLNKEKYLSLISNMPSITSKYIYIYSLNVRIPEDIRWNEIQNMAITNHYDVIVTPSDGYFIGQEIYGKHVLYSYDTIQNWLNHIYQSTLVVTPSFHGIVLSIILQKDFVYVPLKGKYAKGNNRVIDLLQELDLMYRMVSDEDTIENCSSKEINWTHVQKKLDHLKNFSYNFLKQSL